MRTYAVSYTHLDVYKRQVYQQEVTVRPDVVIVGSYPANRDLWQAGKALAAGCMSVRKNGTIILAAPCFEGAYPEHPDVMQLGTDRKSVV